MSCFVWAQSLHFENITKADGLSQDYVLSLHQDKMGFLWIGTYAGLQRYDGSEFLHFSHDPSDSSSISNNVTHAIFEDGRGRLWFGTESGLNLFDPRTNSFQRFYPDTTTSLGEATGHIRTIVQEKNGKMWLATYGGGLFSFQPETKKWQHFYKKNDSPHSLPSNYLNTLFLDKEGMLWVGTESGGLSAYSAEKEEFIIYGPEEGLTDNTIACISQRKDGKLCIGTWRGGLNLFDPGQRKFCDVSYLPDVIAKDNTIRTLVQNEDGSFWVGTQNGLVFYRPQENTADVYRNNPHIANSLGFHYVWSLLKDNTGILWIGTFGGGLSKLDPLANRFHSIRTDTGSCSLPDENITCFLQDSQERTWVASISGGIHIFKKQGSCITGKLVRNLLRGQHVNTLYEDRWKTIWCEAGGKLYHYQADLHLISVMDLSHREKEKNVGFTIYAFAEDQEDNLWMGGWNTGLLKLPKTNRAKRLLSPADFQTFKHSPEDPTSLPSDIIWSLRATGLKLWIGSGRDLCVYENGKGFSKLKKKDKASIFGFYLEKENALWLASGGSGLQQVDVRSGQLKAPHTSLLTSTSLLGIEGVGNHLWLSSDGGLYRMNLKNLRTTHYTTADGLPTNAFSLHGMVKVQNGHLLFASMKGIVEIDPSTFIDNVRKPIPYITDLTLFDVPVSLEHGNKKDRKLDSSFLFAKEVVLKHSENVFTIHFSSIQYTANSKTRYMYHMGGFDTKWYEVGSGHRKATYTNLDPGTYVFQVKAANSDGIWSDKIATMTFVVQPPWWQTWWCKWLTGLAILTSLWLIFQLRTRAIKNRNKLLQREIHNSTRDLVEANELLKEQNEEVTRQSERILEQQQELLNRKAEVDDRNQSLESLNKVKDMLFSVIAHDIRNPVHNFKALIQLALLEAPEKTKEILLQADSQAKSLSDMTTSLLDWAIFQSQKIELQKEVTSLSACCREVVEELLPIAKIKNIHLSCQISLHLYALCDKNALKTVLRNLVTNALKFTYANGRVTVKLQLSEEEGKAMISVQDTGVGMDQDKIALLFQFHSSKKTRGTKGEMGSGLGLVFSYELNKLNGGDIKVESTVGEGSVFHIQFEPVPGENGTEEPLPEDPEFSTPEAAPALSESIELHKATLKGKVIFLVDDDIILRENLNRYLCDIFEIYEFNSAEEALQETQRLIPDLMIVDLNLPGMSGLDFVKKVKSQDATSHIASFILSGETRAEWRLKGFEYGADAYLTKPFDKQILLDKIGHYFIQQEKKIKRYLFDSEVGVGTITDNPLNKAFLEKLVRAIETHLGDADINADSLCDEMAMSRSSLYRKLKSLTGHSVNDFIRNIRLKKSLELIKQRELNISQVAYEVGFNSLSYFTSCFKKHFGFSPSDFQKGKQ